MENEKVKSDQERNACKSTMPMYQACPYIQENTYMMQGMYMNPSMMYQQPMYPMMNQQSMQQPMMGQMGYPTGRDDEEENYRNGSHHHGSHHHGSHHYDNHGCYPYMYDCFGYIPKCGYCGHHHR